MNATKVGQGHSKLLLAQCLYIGPTKPPNMNSITSRRCSGNRNVAEFHEVPEIRGDFARLYVEKGKSYESHSGCMHSWPFGYKMPIDAMLRFAVGKRPRLRRARRKCTPKTFKMNFFRGKMTPLFGKISKFCSESFHNHTESRLVFTFQISRKSTAGKWVKWWVVLLTKTFAKCISFDAISRPFGGGCQRFAGERTTWPCIFL